jgi:hypothetical protein
MLATFLAVLAFQQASGTITVGSKGTKIEIRAHEADSSRRPDSTRSKLKSIVATDDDLRSAYVDADSRTIIARARAARLGQDSALTAYEATTTQRFTIGLAFSKIGRERILFRSENATRVRWARDIGAQIDVIGKRAVAPSFGGTADVDIETVLSPVPYYPGRDAFWLGLDVVKETDSQDDVINPLSKNAEAYYRYKTGDSVSFRLPDRTSVQLREIVVTPRKADWHAVIGSLWFDTQSGQLVRAAFRMSQPINPIKDANTDDKPGPIARMFIPTMEATIDGVAIEYSLHQGRFWLPRTEIMEGSFRAGFVRVPMRIEEKFTYASVNSLDTMPQMRERRPLPPLPDSAVRDSTSRRQMRAARDSAVKAREKEECDRTGQRSIRIDRYDRALPVLVQIPCDAAKLAASPALPGSIFDPGDEVFGDAERDDLLRRAESMMPSIPFVPTRPTIEYGFNRMRYNRVEGLSVGAGVEQVVAPGTSIKFSPRIGTADRVFNAELSLNRVNGQGTRSIGVYRRLEAVSDWGHPLSFGAGVSAFLFGRDEGFYYRTTGAELAGDNLLGRSIDWRVFHEQQSDAVSRTNISLAHSLGTDGFVPQWNIAALRLRETGAAIRKVSSHGLNPYGFRLVSDVRVDGAGGDQNFGRGALDLTASHPLGRLLSRDFSASITAGAGTSVGEVPVQRMWFVGGTNSVRGQAAGAMFGSSYWLTRTELGYGPPGWRRIAFVDIGWAGDRTKWSEIKRPASGAGLGWSFMDGLVRFDVARGIYPEKQWRGALYLDAKF